MSITATCKLDGNKDGAFEYDISSYLLSASVQQGRKKSLDPINPAVATVKLDNADGRFSRKNTGGPYGATFKRGCGITVYAESGYRPFTGYIPSIEQDPSIGSQEVVVTATSCEPM